MDAIITIDAAGRITLFNAAAEHVFRWGAPDALGSPFARFLSAAFRAVLADCIREDQGQQPKKAMVARAIHARSRRKEKVLVKVDCAAIPAGLIESELIGYERGAFTGAVARKIGRFELAT